MLGKMNIDPDELARPVRPPSPRDFIVCGSSRSGTSLACAALYQPPRCVTVMEPWDGMRLTPGDLFSSLRGEIESGVLRRGRLDVAALLRNGSVRWVREGKAFHLATEGEYLLGVKWPAFWRYLELLPETRFVVCLRHPAEVIASYLDAGGQLAQGMDYEIKFNQRMNQTLRSATDNPMMRRIMLFDYVHAQIIPHLSRPNVLALRYERWFSEPERVLEEISDFLAEDLSASPIRIAPSQRRTQLSAEDLSLIREDCATAAPLGYEL